MINPSVSISSRIGKLALVLSKAKELPGGKLKACCPAHDDHNPSLSVAPGDDGRILLTCFADCSFEEIAAALATKGFPKADLFPPSPDKSLNGKPKKKIIATHDYTDEHGELLYQAVRYEPKGFTQRRPDGNGGWIYKLNGTKRVLYRLPEVTRAVKAGQMVYIVEGEKSADAVRALGLVATTNSGGVGQWRKSYGKTLDGIPVVVIPDNDKVGRNHAEKVARSVWMGGAQSVKILDLPGLADKGDVFDWLANGGDKDQLEKLAGLADDWLPEEIREQRAIDTDLQNARRLIARHGKNIRYVHVWGKWLVWDGKRWKLDTTGELMRLAMDTVTGIYLEASKESDSEKRTTLGKWATRSESRSRLEAMAKLAEDLTPITPDELDTKQWLLACENGTLDLQTGKLRPHKRRDYITKLIPVAHDTAAKAPRWLAFLDRIMGGNQDLIEFLRRAVGYSLTGDTSEQVLFLLYGTGANGKSTFLEVMQALLADYARQSDFTTFLAKERNGPSNDIARLKGARFVSAVEAESGRRFSEVMVKQLTGGDKISARFLHQEFFEFTPEFKLWLAANHKPVIRGTDNAIWRRIRLIPFTVTIPEPERDKHLVAKLKAEMPGILAWAVRGCLKWQDRDLQMPEEIRNAIEAYREEMDIFAGFFGECCTIHRNAKVSSGNMYQAYTKWCDENGERAKSQNILGRRLSESGFERARSTGGKFWWYGIGLAIDDVQDDFIGSRSE